MHFENVYYPTDKENLHFLAPIPLYVKKFDDTEFHRDLYEWGMKEMSSTEKLMGQELVGKFDEERRRMFPEYLKPDSWIESEDVPIGSRFAVSPNNFLENDHWQVEEIRNRIENEAKKFLESIGHLVQNVSITESWIQYYDPAAGRGHNQHNHTRWQDSEKKALSFSGGYYLSDGDPSRDHPYSGAFCFHVRDTSHFIRPKEGMLMMWPSDIVHSVKPFYGREHRCVINFNFFAETDK